MPFGTCQGRFAPARGSARGWHGGHPPRALAINKQFIEAAGHGDAPEQRFRFTNKCVEGGCKQWNGQGCGIAEQIVKHMHRVDVTAELPACGIRANCRWHFQSGADACRICPLVITEITEEEVREFERKAQMP